MEARFSKICRLPVATASAIPAANEHAIDPGQAQVALRTNVIASPPEYGIGPTAYPAPMTYTHANTPSSSASTLR